MTALEVLEEALQKEQHTSSRAMAKVFCRRVIGMLEDGKILRLRIGLWTDSITGCATREGS